MNKYFQFWQSVQKLRELIQIFCQFNDVKACFGYICLVVRSLGRIPIYSFGKTVNIEGSIWFVEKVQNPVSMVSIFWLHWFVNRFDSPVDKMLILIVRRYRDHMVWQMPAKKEVKIRQLTRDLQQQHSAVDIPQKLFTKNQIC